MKTEDYGAEVERLARRLWGDPTGKPTKDELRFGHHGSKSIITGGQKAGTWFDYEINEGGGVKELREKLGELVDDEPQPRKQHKHKRPIGATYDYLDDNGKLLFQSVRYSDGQEPRFQQRQPDGKGGWIWNIQGVRRVLYRLPQLLGARKNRNGHPPRIYVVEGEKDADRLAAWGLVATTNAMGALKWLDDYSHHLAGCDVVILPDNDKTGREHAEMVARSVAPHADTVRLIPLSGLPAKGDISDWIDQGGDQSTLEDIVDNAPVYAPAAAKGDGATFPFHLLTLGNWLDRDVPDPDFVLGEILSTTSRAMLVGPTGLGKTMFGLALAMAIAEGRDFLHWRVPKARRVLYLDGEMSRRLMKKRIADEMQRRNAGRDITLFILSREDFPDMPPLNTEAGQHFIDGVIEALGGVDLIVVDNIQAWTAGDQKEETTWEPVLPWLRDLTRRNIGQLWIHHTGHDASHSYGSKTREWQLDVVILMEELSTPPDDADLAFLLKFPKARERTPDNRSDFENAIVTLGDDVWASQIGGDASTEAPARRPLEDYALDRLGEALAVGGETITQHPKIPVGTSCVTLDLWRRYFCQNYVGKAEPENVEKMFYRFAAKLQAHQRIRVEKPWVWRV